MMRMLSLRRIKRDDAGATLVEFGLITPVLAITLMGLFDMGYGMYVASVMQGALHNAARLATVGTMTGPQINARVVEAIDTVAPHAAIDVKMESYSNFSDVKKPEKIVGDTDPQGVYNTGDCYEDANNNGRYDLDRGKTGLGQADDIVNYTVTVTYKRLFPMYGLLGWSKNAEISDSTVLRNQPFAARTTGVVKRCN